MEGGLKKQYGLLMAICMVVGTVIGSGVFFKAQAVLNQTNGDMPLGIIAWIIGGTVMIFCILAFCVMAQRY
jgi:APA family basic amino acid/polyamine antiporter